MKEPTLEEIKELVTFTRDFGGGLEVFHIKGNVLGHVQGDVEGEVWGNVEGEVYGDVGGSVNN